MKNVLFESVFLPSLSVLIQGCKKEVRNLLVKNFARMYDITTKNALQSSIILHRFDGNRHFNVIDTLDIRVKQKRSTFPTSFRF